MGVTPMFLRSFVICVISIAIATEVPARAQTGPLEDPIPKPIPRSHIRVSLKPVATGLTAPVYLVVIPGDNNRMFVVDQTGLIVILKNGVVQAAPFLDITGVLAQLPPAFPGAPQGVNPGYDERGLLGLAFHPGFDDHHSPGFRTLYTLHNAPVGRPADFPQPQVAGAGVPNCQEVIAEWRASHDD